jgi:Protein of unknown function (DUF3309)
VHQSFLEQLFLCHVVNCDWSTQRAAIGVPLHQDPRAVAAGSFYLEATQMSLGTILLIILILILVGALPTWPYSSAWGYYPSSGFGLVLVIVLILVLLGRI